MATGPGARRLADMTEQVSSIAARGTGRAFALVLGGLAVGAAGLVVQWVAAPEKFASFGFPPGLIYLVVAGLIVWFDRRSTWSPAAAVGLALWIVIGGLGSGELIPNLTSSHAGVVTGNLVMCAGLLVSAVAGVAAIAENRRHAKPVIMPLSTRNPRRTTMLVLIAALLAVAVGDAAPEGLRWDGPGPVLFAALALLTALVPGRSMILLAILMSGAFVVGAARSPEVLDRLSTPSDVLGFGSSILQIAGLVVAVTAGALAARPDRQPAEVRRSWEEQPRELP